ncbi:MAG: WD40 repeat domain-containing protein, partial [Armatimonadaceae bacterium]
MRRWKAHRGKIASLSFSRDGRLLASVTGSGRDVFIWDALTGELVRKLTVADEEGKSKRVDVQQVLFSPDQPLLAAVRRFYVELWDTDAWALTAEFEPMRDVAFELAIGPGPCPLIATGEVRHVDIWQQGHVPDAGLKRAASWSINNVPDLAFSADGRWIATHTTSTVDIRDPVSGRRVTKYRHRQSNYTGPLCFSPNSTRLAYCSTKVIEAFRPDRPDPDDVIRYTGHTNKVWVLRYTPDGRSLISASSDGTVRVWEAVTGLLKQCFEMNVGKLLCADVSPDGTTAVAAVVRPLGRG